MQLSIRDSLLTLEEDPTTYIVVSTATRRVRTFSVDALVKDIIGELVEAGTLSATCLSERLSTTYAMESVHAAITALYAQGIITPLLPEQNRHTRQIAFLEEMVHSGEQARAIQNELEKSTVTVLGVGGIGTWMVNGLYQIGIGSIRITDPDTVSESNLNRQLFFTAEDVGLYKVDVLKRKLPDANMVTYKQKVVADEDLTSLLEGSSFVVNCADSPSVADTTRILDGYAKKWNIPYCVAGGYNMHLGMVGPIIVPGKTATFDDFLEYQKAHDPLKDMRIVKDVTQTGSVGPIAGTVANLQVLQIFKYLTGVGTLEYDAFTEWDFMQNTFETRRYAQR